MEAKAASAPSQALECATHGSSRTSWHYFVDTRGVQPADTSIIFSVSAQAGAI